MRTAGLSAQDVIQDMTMLKKIRKTGSLTNNQDWMTSAQHSQTTGTPLKLSEEEKEPASFVRSTEVSKSQRLVNQNATDRE